MAWDVDSLVDRILSGNEESSVDDKGRVVIGKDNRENLGDSFFMGLDKEGCAVIYPRETVKQILLEIQQSPVLNEGREEYAQMWAEALHRKLSCDSQGRLTIPAKLRHAAGIKDRVVLVGAIDRILVWPKADYEAQRAISATKSDERQQRMREAYKRMVEGANDSRA